MTHLKLSQSDFHTTRLFLGLFVGVVTGLFLCMSQAQSQETTDETGFGDFQTIQDYVETLDGPESVDLDDEMSVFRFVFLSLPDAVKVYPTEDYFYFTFNKDGIGVSGNLRLDMNSRDSGKFHFAYFSTHSNMSDEKFSGYKFLGKDDGLVLKKVDTFEYDLTYEGRTVRFSLNDLRDVKPPETMTHKDEAYIGPVFDESGVQFYLVYNRVQKVFHYVLNESEVLTDQFTPSQANPDLLVGHRTDFLLYPDPLLERYLLVGVNNANTEKNNYFDGPFDQLPDNFVQGEALRDALIDKDPSLKGIIDRLGGYDNGESRVVIAPYIHYTNLEEIKPIMTCLETIPEKEKERSYACFDDANLEPFAQ